MQRTIESVLLRVYIGEDAHYRHNPLYEAIVLKAREMHLAGATVLRGPLGFGHSQHLHNAKILRLSGDLPVVVEIVDSDANVQRFLPALAEMIGGGLVTLEKVQVVRFGRSQGDAVSADVKNADAHRS